MSLPFARLSLLPVARHPEVAGRAAQAMVAARRAFAAALRGSVSAALSSASRTAAIALSIGVPAFAPMVAAFATTSAFVPLCQPTEPFGPFQERWTSTRTAEPYAGFPLVRPFAAPSAARKSSRVRKTEVRMVDAAMTVPFVAARPVGGPYEEHSTRARAAQAPEPIRTGPVVLFTPFLIRAWIPDSDSRMDPRF